MIPGRERRMCGLGVRGGFRGQAGSGGSLAGTEGAEDHWPGTEQEG